MTQTKFREEHPDYNKEPEDIKKLDVTKTDISFFVYEEGEIVERSFPSFKGKYPFWKKLFSKRKLKRK
jgi:hypothetical protein